MSPLGMQILSKGAFIGSIILVLYIVYFEWKSAKINAELDEIKLGEKENEDSVNALDNSDVIDLVNKQFSSTGSAPPTKPASPILGSSDADGNTKTAGNKKP